MPDPGKTLVEVDGEMVALFHVGGTFYAIDDVCTHDGGPLADGELRDHKIACPRHGAKFDIRTGAALSMPAVRPTRAHDVKVEDGGVWVRLRAEAGGRPAPRHASRPLPTAPPARLRAAAAAAAAAALRRRLRRPTAGRAAVRSARIASARCSRRSRTRNCS